MFKFLVPILLFSIIKIDAEDAPSVFQDYYKKLKYETSLAYTKYQSKGVWWSHIAPFKLYLGALPLKNEGHLEEISKLGVTCVLSMVENFEIEDGWANIPVKKEDWEEKGIEVMHIEAVDFLPLKHEEIERGVDFLAQMLEKGETVYVHCKAGRGRSATIVIVYLMKFHHYSFDEAYQFVHHQRPFINLNLQQKKAIFDYFGAEIPTETNYSNWTSNKLYDFFYEVNEISEKKLSILLQDVLHYVIDGMTFEEVVPDSLSTWVPSIEIQSTLQRRNRYLREYQGNQENAVQAAIAKNHGLIRKFKILAASIIPFVGTPTSYSISLWHQLREITLIAALYGHDINDPDVRIKILSCLAGGNVLKLPAYSIDLVAREIIKKIAFTTGLGHAAGSLIPAHLIFNYFTENSAHVASHAIELFGKEKAFPIEPERYWDLNQKSNLNFVVRPCMIRSPLSVN